MEKPTNKVFLYSGLTLLFISFLVRWIDAPLYCFWSLFISAILLKGIFLVNVFRAGDFKASLWLYFILAGVVMIFVSILFKTVFPIPLVRNILFFGAISLKVIGLLLMVFQKRS